MEKKKTKLEQLLEDLKDIRPQLCVNDKTFIRSELDKKITQYLNDKSDKRNRL